MYRVKYKRAKNPHNFMNKKDAYLFAHLHNFHSK